MNSQRRQAYLDAIGLQTWSLRAADPAGPGEAAPEADSVEPSPVAEPQPGPAAAGLAAEPTAAAEAAPEPSAAPAEPVATDWNGLREQVSACRRCGLCETRTQAVFGVGPARAPLAIVGEGPGADEDRLGEPFVGRAGKLLDEMLAAIGRSRTTDTWILNVVKCRPPGNRDPAPAEAEACRPYLEQQLRLIRPRLIVAVGRIAAQRLLQSTEPLARLRGQDHHWGEDRVPVWVTYHPAYLLRSPREKAKSWVDLKRIHRLLEST